MPWEPTTVSLYRTIFPQMTQWLPEEEGAQLRFEFENGAGAAQGSLVSSLLRHSGQRSNHGLYPVQQPSCSSTVVLVVIKNALLNASIATLNPSVKPFDRGSTGWISVAPRESKQFRKCFDREVVCRPLCRGQYYIEVEIDCIFAIKQLLDIITGAYVRISSLEFAVHRPLIFRVIEQGSGLSRTNERYSVRKRLASLNRESQHRKKMETYFSLHRHYSPGRQNRADR